MRFALPDRRRKIAGQLALRAAAVQVAAQKTVRGNDDISHSALDTPTGL
jgi:hypothetical protein